MKKSGIHRDMFDLERLPPAVDALLFDANPWWAGNPTKPIPTYQRWAFQNLLRKFHSGLAPAVVLRGPRQVGKTTLQLQIIKHLLNEEEVHPKRILRIQFDELPSLAALSDPILSIGRWFENRILKSTFNASAQKNEPVYVFLDEVQNLSDWAPQLKTLVDHHSIKVLVTGSSALRIEAGRDSLAGRITQVDLGTLLLREISELRFHHHIESFLSPNGLEPLLRKDFWTDLQVHGIKNASARDGAFSGFSLRGGYPIAQAHADVPWPEMADQLNQTVIQRAIQHDLRMGERGRKRDEQLLEEVFRLACRYAGQSAGQSVFVPEIKQALQANIGWQRILTYLRFLDGAMLIKLVQPQELRLKKRKGNNKICLCDHSLRSSWLEEVIPLEPQELAKNTGLSDLAGHIAESIVGFFLGGLPHLDLSHFPQRGNEPEVDFVMTIGEHRIPLEVKYRQRIDPHRDTLGLRAFIEKSVYNAPFGILVTMHDDVTLSDPRIISVSLSSLLLLR